MTNLEHINLPPLITQRASELKSLCERYHVKTLALFGSALREDFSAESDLDFLLEFFPHYLWDISQAARNVKMFIEGKSFQDCQNDLVLRSAVERQFEIVGEALAQGLKHFPELAGAVTASRQIVDFRNRLIHGYAAINGVVVWGVTEDNSPPLLEEVERALEESDN